jgi:uncharacterized membrane protein
MADRIPPKLFSALANEINSWREDALIDDNLAATLIARYPISTPRSNAVVLLTTIGAVLVGLGTLLYIGANWQIIATIWKISILIVAIVASHVAGWIFKFEPGDRPRLGTAFLLLGSFFFGAGIWLIAQMFNVDINYPTGLLLWFIGTAASALVTRSAAVGIFSSLILGAWTLRLSELWNMSHSSETGDYQVVIGTLTGLCIAWSLRSRAMVWITLLTSSLWIVTESSTSAAGLLMWGFALFGAYLWMRSNMQVGEEPFKYVGTCSALSAMLYLTCDRTSLLGHLGEVNYLSLLSGAVVMMLFLILKFKEYRTEALGCLLLIAYFLIFAANPFELTRVVAFNFMAISAIVGIAWTGVRHLQSPGIANTAIVFAVIYIICRYFDFFFTMMDRSLFFIVGGVVLMTIGAIAERSRRQLLGSMQA